MRLILAQKVVIVNNQFKQACYLLIANMVFLISLSLPDFAVAGELVLKNGDRIAGELQKLAGDKVTWVSDSFGKLTVNKGRIENLSTVTLMKLNGIEEPCALLGMEGDAITYSCRTGIRGSLPLLTVELAMPYENFQAVGMTQRGKLGLSGSYSRGNKIENDWDLDAELELRRADLRHSFGIEYENKALNDQPSKEKYKTEYGVDWFYKTRWFVYSDFELSADESKSIDERHAISGGFGFQLWEEDATALSLTGGFTYVNELFDAPAVPSSTFVAKNDRLAWQFGVDYRYVLPFNAKFFHKNSIFQSLEDSEDWHFESDTGLNMPLWGGLYSELTFEYDFDNLPKGNNQRDDSAMKFGVGYSW